MVFICGLEVKEIWLKLLVKYIAKLKPIYRILFIKGDLICLKQHRKNL